MRYYILTLAFLFGIQSLRSTPSSGQEIAIHLPDTVELGTSHLTVPLTVNDLTGLGLISLEFTLRFDSTVIQIDNVIKEDYLAEVFALLEFNATQPGKVIVAGASGGTPLSGQGTLLALQISFIKEGSSALVFEDFKFDPGNPSTNLINGRVRNITLASRDQHSRLPISFTIEGNYPNPLRNRTHVVLDLHEPAIVGIDVFNSQGQRILNVPSRQMQSGSNQQIELNLSTTPAGTYLYRVTAHSQRGYHSATKFITVIH